MILLPQTLKVLRLQAFATTVDRREDYMQFIPYEIPEEFTAKDFAACAKIPVRLAQTVLLILTDLLIVERIGKQGRSYLYRICEIE